MKTPLISTIAVAALLLGSCAKDMAPSTDTEAISFNGTIHSQKATLHNGGVRTTWANTDSIGIFMVGQGTTTISEGSSNRRYVYDGSNFGPATTGQAIYYPVSDSKVDFIAYYPYTASATLTTDLPIDVSAQSDPSKIDILRAHATNGTAGFSKTSSTTVPLTFEHQLSKIVIKTLAGDGLSTTATAWTGMDVAIKGMNTVTSLDLSTGTLGTASDPQDITPFVRTAGSTYEAIVLPESFTAAGAINFTFQIGNDTFVWNSQPNERFEAGKEYTYTITVNKTSVQLGNVTIKDWETVTRTGTAI